jgi:CheY-like chemotaxis protein
LEDNLKILIIEDRIEFRLMLSQMVEELGPNVNVDVVEDGESAIELTKIKKFDCVLLDYLLGDSTGPIVLKKIKKSQPQIPVIVITAYDNNSVSKLVDKAGASGLISKSDLSTAKLSEVIKGVLKDKRPESGKLKSIGKVNLSFQGLEGMKVLIVDDIPANISVLKNILSNNKLNIHVATSGEAALDITTKTLPHLILMDIMMPGLDGFETCRQLKAKEATKNIPLIFISARSETQDYTKGFALGAVDYITKPFSEEEVLARIHTHLKLAKLVKDKDLSIKDLTDELEQKNKNLEEINKELVLAYENLEGRVEEATSSIIENERYL